MKQFDCVIKNGFIVYPEKTIMADLGISAGLISAVESPGKVSASTVIDAGGCHVLPGVIDPHIHPVYLDDLGEISKTAAFGGVTTLIHYAYAKPGNSLIEVIKQYREEGEAASSLDFALHGGLFETLKQSDEIPEAIRLGVTSFKMFMAYAKLGWMTDDYALTKAMDILHKHGGMAAVHAENGLAIDYIQDKMLAEKANFAERFLETSPDLAEAEGIFRAVSIGELMGCTVYIPHVSSEEALNVMRFCKQMGRRVYAETCPQYLCLTWNELKDRGPLGKVGPSIKMDKDRSALWQAIQEGLIDTIGSDHAPKAKKKEDNFFEAPYGSPEIETMLPVIWHYGVNRGLVTPNKIARLLSENTARIMGLFPQKGRLDIGSDADMVIFDPSESWTISVENQHSHASYTLFEGKEILGRVRQVISRGKLIVDRERYLGTPGAGKFKPTRAGRQACFQGAAFIGSLPL